MHGLFLSVWLSEVYFICRKKAWVYVPDIKGCETSTELLIGAPLSGCCPWQMRPSWNKELMLVFLCQLSQGFGPLLGLGSAHLRPWGHIPPSLHVVSWKIWNSSLLFGFVLCFFFFLVFFVYLFHIKLYFVNWPYWGLFWWWLWESWRWQGFRPPVHVCQSRLPGCFRVEVCPRSS